MFFLLPKTKTFGPLYSLRHSSSKFCQVTTKLTAYMGNMVSITVYSSSLSHYNRTHLRMIEFAERLRSGYYVHKRPTKIDLEN